MSFLNLKTPSKSVKTPSTAGQITPLLAAASIVVLISVLVLVGWTFEIDFLKRLVPGYVFMNPVSAAAFILSSVTLLLLRSHDEKLLRVAKICAAVIAFVGLAKLCAIVTGFDVGIDRLLFADNLYDHVTGRPNQMAPNTALNFFLLGIALLLVEAKSKFLRDFYPSQYLSSIVILTSFLAMIGYLYGTKSFYVIVSFNPMAIHTAGAFVLLAGGLLLSRKERGIIKDAFSSHTGGEMARRLFPLVIIIPIILGWLHLTGERLGLIEQGLGTAMLVVAITVVLGGLILNNARLMNNASVKRRRIENEMLRFASIVESSYDAIVSKNLDGVITSWNFGAERLTGYTAEEMIGQQSSKLFPPDRLDEETNIREAILRGERIEQFETARLSKDGRLRHISLTVSPIKNSEGRIIGVSNIARDITESKFAEETLDAAARRERAMLENALDVICSIDAEGRFAAVSPASLKIWGYRPEELIGRRYIELVAPEDVAATNETALSIMSGVEATHFENRCRHENGSLVNIMWSAFWSETEQLMFCVAHDITERKRVEAELKTHEAQLVEAQRIAHIGSWEWDIAAREFTWSDELYRICGLEPQEFNATYKGFLNLQHPDDREMMANIIRQAIRTQEHQTFDHRMLRPDGTVRCCTSTGRVVLDENGIPWKIMGISQDITERKQIEKELEEARDAALESVRLKSEFLANMSHEIRTPMNGVIGITGLLLDTELSGRQQEYTKAIEMCADALLKIINDILDFSKIEAGHLRFEEIEFDLRETVELPVEMLAENAKAKGIEIASLVQREVPTLLLGDPGRVRQILTNLIGNAIKFTQKGEVVVNVINESETDRHVLVRFEIKDTGIGISEEAQKRLFQAFTQADGSTTRKYGGTGLGLAISKQLVEMMGGEIGVESVPREGSTFWFTAKFEKQSTATVKDQAAPAGGLTGRRALIVDANETNRKILLHQTASWGMIAAEADSGAKALDLLRSAARNEPFDIAVLDLKMPGMDGFQLARTIKAEPSISAIKLILLTSYGKHGDEQIAREMGIAAYLQKPVRQSQLYNCLVDVMNAKSVNADSRRRPLPRLSEQNASRVAALWPKNELPNSASKFRVLVAEDNAINREVAFSQLQSLGYSSDIVHNGREAVEAVKNQKYNVVLMDCQMPEMDGFEATAEIRRMEGESNHTIIIAMTAHALAGEREKCLAAGMDDYLSKPVKKETLRRMLERWTVAADRQADAPAEKSTVSFQKTGHDVVDFSVLEGLSEFAPPGESDWVGKLIALFVEDTTGRLEILKKALRENDVSTIKSQAHNIKGAAGNIGARGMAEICKELEQRKDDNADAEVLIAQLESEFKRLIVILEDIPVNY